MNLNTATGYSHYELLVSEDCNLRCTYCFDDQLHDRSKTQEFNRPAHMSLEMVDDIINFIIRSQNKSRGIFITFFGGEPLMNFKFIEKFVEESRKVFGKRINFGVGTNGTLLNRKRLDYFINNNIKLNFSVDGKKSTHDKRRIFPGGLGSWEKTIKYIPEVMVKAKGLGWAPGVNYTIDAEDIDDFEENFRFVQTLTKGRAQVLFNFQSNWTEERIKRLEEIWDRLFISGNIIFPMRYTDRILKSANSHCNTAQHNVTISSDGGIYFCHRLTPKMYEEDGNSGLKMGNIYDGITDENLESKYLFRTDFKEFRKGKPCENCEVWHPCYGGCLASHAFNGGGTNIMYIDEKIMCRLYKIIYSKTLQDKIRKIHGQNTNVQCNC